MPRTINNKNIALVFLSVILLVCSYPNLNIPHLIWVGLVPFFFLLDAKSPKAAFLWGWLTGFLFFLGTHYWLIHVTLPGMILMNIYLGIYFGLFGLGYAFFQKLPLKHKLWVLPSLWAALEFTRDRLFTGFGWACLGHSQYQILPLIQIADITGVFGVSFLVVMVNVLLKDVFEKKNLGDVSVCLSVMAIMVSVLTYGMTQIRYGYGAERKFMRIAVVQPNIPQSLKWEPESWEPTQKKILALTEESLRQKPDLVIWPETSFPGYTWQSPDRYQEIKDFVARNRVRLLLGTVTMRDGKYYNSAILLDRNGQESARYDKMHLVPFGEFLPLRPLLGWIGRFAPIGDDFSTGEQLTVFPWEGFSTLICFEDTVAPVVRALAKKALYLVNISNDGWFKDTNEPYLHLQGAVFQAVAHRQVIVRASNTGVSGFVGLRGETVAFKDRGGRSVMTEGVLVSDIYPRNSNQLTFYTRYGDVFAYLCFLAAGLALIKRKILL